MLGKLLEPFTISLKREEKQQGSHLVRGAGVGWGEGAVFSLLPSLFCWVDSGCIRLRAVLHCFPVCLLPGGLPSSRRLTHSARHYFIVWNPKMLRCFHGKQSISITAQESGKMSLFPLSSYIQQDGWPSLFIFVLWFSAVGEGAVCPRPSSNPDTNTC